MKKYWHELPQEEVDKILTSGITWGELLETYEQPDWCCYWQALQGGLGCWSLTDNEPNGGRSKISIKFCMDCDLFDFRFTKIFQDKIKQIKEIVHYRYPNFLFTKIRQVYL